MFWHRKKGKNNMKNPELAITNRQAQELANKLKKHQYPQIAIDLELRILQSVQDGKKMTTLDTPFLITAYNMYITQA